MQVSDRVTIDTRKGVTIYGRVINHTGKLGRYEVYSDNWGNDGTVFHLYSDAEKKRGLILLALEREQKNSVRQ